MFDSGSGAVAAVVAQEEWNSQSSVAVAEAAGGTEHLAVVEVAAAVGLGRKGARGLLPRGPSLSRPSA